METDEFWQHGRYEVGADAVDKARASSAYKKRQISACNIQLSERSLHFLLQVNVVKEIKKRTILANHRSE